MKKTPVNFVRNSPDFLLGPGAFSDPRFVVLLPIPRLRLLWIKLVEQAYNANKNYLRRLEEQEAIKLWHESLRRSFP